MAGVKKRISSTSNSRISEDVDSLDSWTDILNNSSSSESNIAEYRHDGYSKHNLHGSTGASGVVTGRKERVQEIKPVIKSNKERVSHAQSASNTGNLSNGIRTVSGLLQTECDLANDLARSSLSTSSEVHTPSVFRQNKQDATTSGHKSTKKHQDKAASKLSHKSDKQDSSVQHRSSSSSQPRPMSQSMGSGLDELSTRYGLAPSYLHQDQYHSSPYHGPHTSAKMSRSVNGEFGSDNTDLFVRKLETESEKMKTKLQSAWNNMKYGWTLKTKTNFKNDSAIILLGKWYHVRPPEELEDPSQPKVPSLEEFKQDFASRLWFTYRREFTPLPGTKFTTDCGWGCMLRSGQCMIAQALIQHFLGREWRIYNFQDRDQIVFHREIIRWFSDISTDNSPFSIYKLVEIGKKNGKQPGDWYGPASVAHIFRDALMKAYSPIPLLSDVCIYVAQDCTVYKQDIIDVCTARRRSSSTRFEQGEDGLEFDGWNRSVIILIPVRLGGESLNEIYVPCVKQILSQENCVGIIGGKPRHSLYFLGWQDEKLIYLDPHYCQDAVDTSQQDFPIQSFHCLSPRKLPFNKMDPSCTIGFYCRNEEDFETFVTQVEQMVIPKREQGMYPLFVFEEGRGSDITGESLPEEQGYLRIRHVHRDPSGRARSCTTDSEDFVIL